MSVKIGINGFGRIGRSVFRVLAGRDDIEVVAINDLFDNSQLAYLLKHDTVMGVFPGEVAADGDTLTVNGQPDRHDRGEGPAKIPWGKLGVDIVIESTGVFATREQLQKHLGGGRQEGDPDRSGQGRDRRHDRHGRQRRAS